MLIFGFGKTTFKPFGLDRPVVCERCGNQTQYGFFQRRTWFTLFFIPVIPTGSAHLVICPICSHALEMPKDLWDARRRDAGLG